MCNRLTRLVMTGALGPWTSVTISNGSDGSPSFFHVKAFSHSLYLVKGSRRKGCVWKRKEDGLIQSISVAFVAAPQPAPSSQL